MIQIECKLPGNTATDLQVLRITEWRESGAVAFVAWSLDDVKRVLEAEGLIMKMDDESYEVLWSR